MNPGKLIKEMALGFKIQFESTEREQLTMELEKLQATLQEKANDEWEKRGRRLVAKAIPKIIARRLREAQPREKTAEKPVDERPAGNEQPPPAGQTSGD